MDTQHFNISAAEKQESLEEVNTEVAVYCGMLYFLVQVFKGDDEFGEELSKPRMVCRLAVSWLTLPLVSLDPPLPVYLFGLVSAMKEKSAKGYPLKKVRTQCHRT